MKHVAVIGAVSMLLASACSTSSSTPSSTTAASSSSSAVAPSTSAAASTSSSQAGSSSTAPSSSTSATAAGAANPFTGTDAFCKSSPPLAGLKAGAAGVTADTITLVHIRSQLEKLEPIGFAAPVGDTDDIIKVLAGEINKCGGINGRKIDMKTVEFDPLDTSVEKVCVAATEDIKSFGVISSTGWAGPTVGCVAVDKRKIVLSASPVPAPMYAEAQGRVITSVIPDEDGLKLMVDALMAQKKLDGKKIGVVASTYNGTDKLVQVGLVDYLKSKGQNVVKFEVLDCQAALCNQGHQAAVENLKNAGVEVLFPTMNLVTLPYFVKEAAVQSFKPTFYQSNFNNMDGDLTNSQVVAFGGEEAGKLYAGTLVFGPQRTGDYRSPDFKPDPFNEMCNATYSKATTTGAKFDAKTESTKYGMVATMCAHLRVFARAAFDAGADLTPESWAAAAGKLGKIDMNAGIPGTITDKKRYEPTELRTGTIVYPCPDPLYKLCVQPTGEPPFKIA